MITPDIATITLLTTVAFFIISFLSKRTANPSSKLHFARRVLAGAVLAMAVIYFYKRFTG